MDTARAAELGVLGASIALLDVEHAGVTQLAAVHGDRRLRVASVGSGVFGTDFVYITDQTQQGFLYISPSLNAYLHAVRPKATGPPPPPLALSMRTAATQNVAGRKCQELRFTAATPVPIDWRLWFCADADLRPFARPVADTHTGSPPAVAAAVSTWGMPLRGELTLGNHLASPTPASSFHLDAIEIAEFGDYPFNVPAGATDLRGRDHDTPQ